MGNGSTNIEDEFAISIIIANRREALEMHFF